jgi:hypothetical protein
MAGRKPLGDEPMTAAQRIAKSAAARTARGEFRLNAWLTPEGHAALRFLTGQGGDAVPRGAVNEATNAALIAYAKAEGQSDTRRRREAQALASEL